LVSAAFAWQITKEVFVHVLRNSPEPWLTSSEIRKRTSALKEVEIPMGTIAPNLTEMKGVGIVMRDGLKVALAERVPKNGAPAGAEASFAVTGESDRH
jgi:hypothetical protein